VETEVMVAGVAQAVVEILVVTLGLVALVGEGERV
jgi:hypothetical protein